MTEEEQQIAADLEDSDDDIALIDFDKTKKKKKKKAKKDAKTDGSKTDAAAKKLADQACKS